MKNEGFLERLIQLTIASVLFIGALFWLASPWQYIAFGVSGIIAILALIGFCPLYAIIGKNATCDMQDVSVRQKMMAVAYVCMFIGIGSYGSIFLTKKIFIEDFNKMNTYYKQALFETGQRNRFESKTNYDLFMHSWTLFKGKYCNYQPYTMRNDTR